jgi:MFS family permease
MLRVWAISLTVLTGPLLFFVRPRIPTSQSHQPRRINLSFLKDRTFLFLQLGNVLQGLGYFVPTIYLPTYARSLGLDNAIVTTTVALLNSSAVFGCIFVGVLIDRFHITTVTLISTIGATFSVFVLWGLASSVPLLLTFSIVYGFFAGSFSSTYSGAIKELRKDHSSANPGMIIGMLAAGRGIGSIACGPLSEALLKGNPWQGQAALGYGTGYGALISFTGATAMLGGVSFVARRVGWI